MRVLAAQPDDELIARDKVSLDLLWLRDESLEDSANLPDPHLDSVLISVRAHGGSVDLPAHLFGIAAGLALVSLKMALRPRRHPAVSNVNRATRDLFLAQRFARHASPLTTTVYTHPSDEEMRARLQTLPC
jgi:hypothetical protein